jgi:hypothetical protein
MLYFTERPHCLLAKLNSLGLRGSSEVNSRERESKSICSGENFERGWRHLSRSSVLQSKKDLTSPLEGTGQSSGLILGSYLGRYPIAERNLAESTFTRELQDIKNHAETPLMAAVICLEKLFIQAGA